MGEAVSGPEYRLGAPILTADGHTAGRVDRIVLDTDRRQVIALVMHEGGLLMRDVIVPIEEVVGAWRQAVRLRLRADQLDSLPDFVETAYVPLESTDVPPLITWEGPPDYIPHAVLVPAASLYAESERPYAPQIVVEEKEMPPSATDLPAGTEVSCPDGPVGVVVEVLTDPDDRVTFIVVAGPDGRYVLPIGIVGIADGEGIRLSVRRCDLEPFAAGDSGQAHSR